MQQTKPFLRWAGSKKQLLPELCEYWSNEFTRYVEPFAGSAALFFRLQPKKALLGDLNEELVEVYKSIKTNPTEIAKHLAGYDRSSSFYYTVRALNPKSLTETERAARFIYLNRLCFNGIFRTNLKGEFNVPYGGERSGLLPTAEHIGQCSKALSRAVVKAGDFELILSNVRKGDFVYLDPPYAVESRRVFKEYGPKPFASDDLNRLSDSLKLIAKKKAKFVMSYADSKEGRLLGKPWQVRRVQVQRNVAGFSANRRTANELLITNIDL